MMGASSFEGILFHVLGFPIYGSIVISWALTLILGLVSWLMSRQWRRDQPGAVQILLENLLQMMDGAIEGILPGRVNLVMTRSGKVPFEGMEPVAGIDAALAAVAGHEAGELCVIGGGEIYREWLPLADVLQLTHVDTLIDGADAWFPEWSPAQWREVSRAAHAADARHRFAFEFVEYVRSDG